MAGAAIERDRFDGAMRDQQDRATGRLIDAARLHADEAVFDQIEPSDTVVVAEFVEPRQDRRRRQSHAVDRNSIALGKTDGDRGRMIGRIHRRNGALINDRRRFDRRILQHFSF